MARSRATSRPSATSPDEVVRMITGDIGRSPPSRRTMHGRGRERMKIVVNAFWQGRSSRSRVAASAGVAAAQEIEGQDLLSRADAARRVPDRLDRRHHQVHEGRRLRGGLARRAEPVDDAAEPDRRRDQPEAEGRHPGRGRFRRGQGRHREDARRRHPGDDLRPADHLDAVRLHLRRRHRRDRPYRGRRDRAAADREARLAEGQGAADPRRSRRPLHPRYPEGLRGEDGGPPGGDDHHAGGHAVGGRQRRATSRRTSCSPIPTST